MNQANQKQLIQQTNQGLIGIRQSEVNYFQGLNVAFGTQAALIGGFTYSVFSQNVVNESNGYQHIDVLTSLYWIFASVTIAFAVHVIFCTTLMQMLGPGLALNGPVGSMARAAEGMRIEEKPIIRSFFAMIFMFSIATVLSCWVVMNTKGAIACTVVLAFSACIWYKYCQRIYLRFYWDRDELAWGERGSAVDNPNDAAPTAGAPGPSPSGKTFKPAKTRYLFFKRTSGSSSRSTECETKDKDGGGNSGVAMQAMGSTTRFGTKAPRGVVMEGYITKRGGGTSFLHIRGDSWERRYFTLTSAGNLFVFKTREDFRNNHKKPIYTRPLQLEDYFIEVLSGDKKSVLSRVDGESCTSAYCFQMTLVLRENVRAAFAVTTLGGDSSGEVLNVLGSSASQSSAARIASSSSSSSSLQVTLLQPSARQDMCRDHWVLRCDTDEELQQWVSLINAMCPSCFNSF